MTLETGSAKNTPITPKPTLGRISVSGTTMKALRKSEKKIAWRASPIAWNADCPADWSAMNTKPKK